jgi:hypothetical protein
MSMVFGFTVLGEQFTETDLTLIQYKATLILDTNGVQVIIPGQGGRIHPSERVIELDQPQAPAGNGAGIGVRGPMPPSSTPIVTRRVWPLNREMQRPDNTPMREQGQMKRNAGYQTPRDVAVHQRAVWTATRSDYPPIQTTMIRSNHDLVSKTEQEVEHLKNEMKRRDEREQAMMQQMTRLNKQVCDLEKNVVSKSDLTEVMLEERQATHTLIKDATSEQKANLLELRAIMAALSSKLDGMV